MGSAASDDDDGRRRRPHVAVVAFPSGSHAAPLLALARALALACCRPPSAAAATFSFFCTARQLAPLRAGCDRVPNLRLVAVPEGEGDGEEEEMRRIERFAAAAAAAAAAAEAEVSCVVSDAFVWAAGEAAEKIGVPWVPLWTSGPHSLVAHLRKDLLRSTFGLGPQAMEAHGDDALGFVAGLSGHHRVRDLPGGIVSGPPYPEIVLLLLTVADRLLRRPPALVLNTFLGFDPTVDSAFASEFDHYLPVGPLHLLADPPHPLADPDPSNCLSWLDQHPPASVAYVAFGTIAMPPPAELAALANGLESSRAPFVWSLKESAQELLPPGFSDRVRANGTGLVVSWAPQKAVLGHAAVGAFVSHCGWNSVIESAAAGVPMVCRPFFGDQRMNARAVESVWGNGIVLSGGVATKEAVAGALDVVLRGVEGRRMRERAREIKAKAAAATSVGGSSSENLMKLLKIVCGYG